MVVRFKRFAAYGLAAVAGVLLVVAVLSWGRLVDLAAHKERALATVLATALTGHRCHLVLGARALPTAFHAWVAAADGTEIGAEEAGGGDHPWTPVYTTP